MLSHELKFLVNAMRNFELTVTEHLREYRIISITICQVFINFTNPFI